MAKYVIKREDDPRQMLMGCGIGCNANNYTHKTEWTERWFLRLELNQEEAQATIDFITNVLDQELGEQLYLEEIKEQGRS